MDRAIGFVVLAVVVVIVTAAALVKRHRREIARSLDGALVGGLAAGLRETRALRDKAATFRKRVIEKADEPESRRPD